MSQWSALYLPPFLKICSLFMKYITFLQIDVVLRCDLGPANRELFVREAKIMSGLDHEYIMKFYGAVILGPYAHSVGLVSNQCFMSIHLLTPTNDSIQKCIIGFHVKFLTQQYL